MLPISVLNSKPFLIFERFERFNVVFRFLRKNVININDKDNDTYIIDFEFIVLLPMRHIFH